LATHRSDEDALQEPPGVHFVYESGLKKIEQQEKLIESLDVKIGISVGFLGALILGLLVAQG
jgi:hypothetical protein